MFPRGLDLGYTFLAGKHMKSVCPSMGDVGFDPLVKVVSVEDGVEQCCLCQLASLLMCSKKSVQYDETFFAPPGPWKV